MKNHTKPRDFSLLWKTCFKKKVQSFLRVTLTPLFPKSVVSGVYTTFPQKTQKSLITDSCHWLESLTVILGFWKYSFFRETIIHFRTITFSKSLSFQFSIPILDGLWVSFNPHHFFMRKQFMCVGCCTGRLTFSNIILYKRGIR